jgi:prepilin-type N-terminal cleavage/methylation domain-containing protein/prepilin-type processing-associated H-X9-DG protein
MPMKKIFLKKSPDGFTLVELLVVLATIAVLAAMLLPALASTHPNSQAFQCMNNQKQIILAWQMYAADNNDILPPNDFYSGDGNPIGFGKGLPFDYSWVEGEMDQVAGNTQATNTVFLSSPYYSALARYTTNAAIYHCPSDQSVVTGVGHRVRSVSMNEAVGTVWNHPSANVPAGGPLPKGFLDSNGGGWSDTAYSAYWRTYAKLGSMVHPSPSALWVIADENPFTINDAIFNVSMGIPDANGNATSTTIVDTPADYHDGSCTFAFADGHVEIHKWLGSTIKITQAISLYQARDSLQDLQWLQAHTTATK